MKGFNLSEWAIGHRSFITYLMLAILIAGIGSYFRLGSVPINRIPIEAGL